MKGTYNYDNLMSYCKDKEINLLIDYYDKKVTRDTIITGICKNVPQIWYNDEQNKRDAYNKKRREKALENKLKKKKEEEAREKEHNNKLLIKL